MRHVERPAVHSFKPATSPQHKSDAIWDVMINTEYTPKSFGTPPTAKDSPRVPGSRPADGKGVKNPEGGGKTPLSAGPEDAPRGAPPVNVDGASEASVRALVPTEVDARRD